MCEIRASVEGPFAEISTDAAEQQSIGVRVDVVSCLRMFQPITFYASSDAIPCVKHRRVLAFSSRTGLTLRIPSSCRGRRNSHRLEYERERTSSLYIVVLLLLLVIVL